MASIFTRIVKGEIPCHKISEDENYLAFLDINPLVKGHTLVIPKREIDYLFDLDDELLAGMTVFAKKIAHAIDQVMDCKRVGVVVLGLEVPHAHIHLIPINSIYDTEFSRPKLKLTSDELEQIAEKIRKALNG